MLEEYGKYRKAICSNSQLIGETDLTNWEDEINPYQMASWSTFKVQTFARDSLSNNQYNRQIHWNKEPW
jgi:hypothetical protein